NLAHRLQTPRPRRPQLRADVVRDRDALPGETSRQLVIESPEVDRDEDVGARLRRALEKSAARRHELGNLGDGLSETGDGQAPVVRDRAPACRDELRSAQAED